MRYNRPYTIALPDAEPVDALRERIGSTLRRCRAARSCAHRSRTATSARAQRSIERYDAVVRGTTAIPPRLRRCRRDRADPGRAAGVALAVDGNPRYGRIDPQRAAELAVVEAVRNVAAVGARPLGMTDCLNFGDPTDPRSARRVRRRGRRLGARRARVGHAVRFGQRQPLQPVEGRASGRALADRGVRRRRSPTSRKRRRRRSSAPVRCCATSALRKPRSAARSMPRSWEFATNGAAGSAIMCEIRKRARAAASGIRSRSGVRRARRQATAGLLDLHRRDGLSHPRSQRDRRAAVRGRSWAGDLLEREVWFAEYGGFVVEVGDDAAFAAVGRGLRDGGCADRRNDRPRGARTRCAARGTATLGGFARSMGGTAARFLRQRRVTRARRGAGLSRHEQRR